MSLILRVVRSLPESYLLNIPQIFHMAVLAGFVPWYIGVESYGRFAAVVAIPGLCQSIFEAFCVAILLRYQRKDVLVRPIISVVVPLLVVFSLLFFSLIPPIYAVLATAMTAFLFCRSFAFAVAIASGVLNRSIVLSEGLILISYIVVALFGVQLEIRDMSLPMAMILVASAASFGHLLYEIRIRKVMMGEGSGGEIGPLPLHVVARALMVRAYEDGLLTLSPLVLALTASTAVAGQFRVLVSVIKFAYKLFPFRYEVVMRDVKSGRQSLRNLVLACGFYAVASGLASLVVPLLTPVEGFELFLPLVAASGAAVSCLSVYPVSCSMDRWVWLALMIGLLGTYLLSYAFGMLGFVIGFCFNSYFVMVRSLLIIDRKLKKPIG